MDTEAAPSESLGTLNCLVGLPILRVLSFLDTQSLCALRETNKIGHKLVSFAYPAFEHFIPKKIEVLKSVFEGGRNIFLNGPAGCGKTTVVKAIKRAAAGIGKSVVMLAPTNMACQVMPEGARTIHSFIGVPRTMCREKFEEWYNTRYVQHGIRPTLKKPSLLVLDEVSMMGSNLLYMLDFMLRKSGDVDTPFGGVQVVATGDFMQLPPVLDSYCFTSPVWHSLNFLRFDLEFPLRQSCDRPWYALLQQLRTGQHAYLPPAFDDRIISEQEVDALMKRDGIAPVLLSANNRRVEELNAHYFSINPNPIETENDSRGRDAFFTYERVNGRAVKMFFVDNNLKKPDIWRAPELLQFKIGARYLITDNLDVKGGIINGRGATYMGDAHFLLDTGKRVHLQTLWSTFACPAGGGVWMERKQFALRLGWAVTYHKCQGMTLHSVVCDGSDWRSNMMYVGFSRVRSMSHLYLFNLKSRRVLVSKKALRFYGLRLVAYDPPPVSQRKRRRKV